MTSNNILGLSPLNPENVFGMDPMSQFPDYSSRTGGDLYMINQGTIKRSVIIDSTAGIGEYAVRRASRMDVVAFETFFSSSQSILDLNQEAKGNIHQKYCDAFSDRLIKVMARHTFGYLEAGALRIAYEVNRPPLPEDKPGGLLRKIFG